jgi:hypothetical protein
MPDARLIASGVQEVLAKPVQKAPAGREPVPDLIVDRANGLPMLSVSIEALRSGEHRIAEGDFREEHLIFVHSAELFLEASDSPCDLAPHEYAAGHRNAQCTRQVADQGFRGKEEFVGWHAVRLDPVPGPVFRIAGPPEPVERSTVNHARPWPPLELTDLAFEFLG